MVLYAFVYPVRATAPSAPSAARENSGAAWPGLRKRTGVREDKPQARGITGVSTVAATLTPSSRPALRPQMGPHGSRCTCRRSRHGGEDPLRLETTGCLGSRHGLYALAISQDALSDQIQQYRRV